MEIRASTPLLVICIYLTSSILVNGLKCYKCDKTPLNGHCNTTVTCPVRSSCYIGTYEADGARYLLQDCIDTGYCQQYVVGIVGRRDLTVSPLECKHCCDADLCNTDKCPGPSILPVTTTKTTTTTTTIPTSNTPIKPVCSDLASECAFPEFLSAVCLSESTATQYCPKSCHICKVSVDGNWAIWGDWGVCTVTCGQGTITRHRTCSNPAPLNGGHDCLGDTSQTSVCNRTQCPVDGGWSDWSSWVTCNVTCGGGGQTRLRTCSNPRPEHDGKPCNNPHSFIEHQPCGVTECPVDGGWSDWSSWVTCNVTCGGGGQSRLRTCSNPRPEHGGKPCDNPHSFIEHQPCGVTECPVDGGWSDWSSWVTCNVTCGGGGQSRLRTCSNPRPEHGGKPCDNPHSFIEHQPCGVTECPVDGHWSDWSGWTTCNVTCSGGTHSRVRTCTNPKPQHGGKQCPDLLSFVEHQPCNTQSCPVPVDGQWSDWSAFSPCNVTCGGGREVRVRTCSNPAPSGTGKDCDNPTHTTDSKDCNTQWCPVDGQWSDWSSWLPCNVTCGGGTSSRTRSCTNPAPLHGGQPCEHPDQSIEYVECNKQPCGRVDGGWSDWSSWRRCNVTCGGGTRFRVRTCSDPLPANGGLPCDDPRTYHEYGPCNLQACPVASTQVVPVSTTSSPHLEPVQGCNDSTFCRDSHIQPLACQDAYIANTYCPKMCGICGVAVSPAPCADSVGSQCNDPIYLKFACTDVDLAPLCAKSCNTCH